MLDPYSVMVYHHQHHRELVDEASQRRLAAIAQTGRGILHPRHYAALAAFGRQLCHWGEHIQARYSPVEWVTSGETIH
jgi:hypothetical protein